MEGCRGSKVGGEAHLSRANAAETQPPKLCFPTMRQPENGSADVNGCNAGVSCSTPESSKTGCKDDCCSEPSVEKAEDPSNPSCCEGKPSPCCDESCIERIALRECDVLSGTCDPNPTSRVSVTDHRRYYHSGKELRMPRTREGEAMCSSFPCRSRQVFPNARCHRVYLPRALGPWPGVVLPAQEAHVC